MIVFRSLTTSTSFDSPRAEAASNLRVFVAIASHGTKNERFLARVIAEYRSMPYVVNVVVLSDIPKNPGQNVRVHVGLPDKNPWSLPFGHKQLFAEHVNDYDLFIYSEDDILITQRNIEAFLAVSKTLPEELIAGFVHAERDDQGGLYFDPVHSHFHWDPHSVRSIEGHTFAYYTNEHSACYLLTQDQLKRALQSGGFLVAPHENRYDMLCTAATDPYTQCGFKKMVCLSRLEDFTVYHLPNNKYAARPYRASSVFYQQIEALLNLERNGRPRNLLFNPETRLLNAGWSKDYYEGVRNDVLSLVPPAAKKILSIGCGWGATEQQLVKQGVRVVGIPIDSVIGSCAEQRGIEVVYADLKAAHHMLAAERFDCIFFINVLHLLPDPEGVLSSYTELLAAEGVLVIVTPNFANVMTRWRRLIGDPYYKGMASYQNAGLHLTSRRMIRKWLRTCGMTAPRTRGVFSGRMGNIQRALKGVMALSFASELVMDSRKPAASLE